MKQIAKEAERLAIGESIRIVCPYCGGGNSKEKSMGITRNSSEIVYHCFKGNCGKKGKIRDNSSYMGKGAKLREANRRYEGELLPITPAIYKSMFKKYEIPYEDVIAQGVMYAKNVHRVYFPVYNWKGEVIGENLKSIERLQAPKTLVNKFGSESLLHFPLGIKLDKDIVLVEDQISAIKLSKIIPTVALMGTNISDNSMTTLIKLKINRVHVMLDGDTAGYKGATVIARKLGPFFKTSVIVAPLGMDPKDLSYKELKEVFV